MKPMFTVIILAAVLIILFPIAGCGPVYNKIKADLGAQPLTPKEDENKFSDQKPSLPEKFVLHSVPHNPRRQRGMDCAPDSLRMVLNYYEKECKEGELVRKLDSRGRRGGVSLGQLAKIAKQYDLEAYLMSGVSLDILKAFLFNGWPPIMSYKARRDFGHAVVVVGYDDAKKRLLVHDPNFVKVHQFPYHQFLPAWKQTGNSCLLIVPKGLTRQDIINAVSKYIGLDVQ